MRHNNMPKFSIATLVTDLAEYAKMQRSFREGGFTEPDCEFLTVDNTGTVQTSAYLGLNQMLEAAAGRYVLLCHQDVRLIEDGYDRLTCLLEELETHDPTWAVAGNAGGRGPGRIAICISDPHGESQHRGNLPAKVTALDENFMVVKREARVGFSRDLDGFHMYGADLCLVAQTLGYGSYVINFHLRHLSGGKISPEFLRSAAAFRKKWSRAFRPRWIQTTCTLIFVSGSRLSRWLPWLWNGSGKKFLLKFALPKDDFEREG